MTIPFFISYIFNMLCHFEPLESETSAPFHRHILLICLRYIGQTFGASAGCMIDKNNF